MYLKIQKFALFLMGLLFFQPVWAQGVDFLPFKNFFKSPISSNGPEFTDMLLNSHRQNRQIIGFMVQQENPHLGRFLLAPRPVMMTEHADGEADDLPVMLVTVYLDTSQEHWIVPHTRGLISLFGRIEVGRHEETDGRVSWVRMRLTPESLREVNPLDSGHHLHSKNHTH